MQQFISFLFITKHESMFILDKLVQDLNNYIASLGTDSIALISENRSYAFLLLAPTNDTKIILDHLKRPHLPNSISGMISIKLGEEPFYRGHYVSCVPGIVLSDDITWNTKFPMQYLPDYETFLDVLKQYIDCEIL